MLFHKNVKKLSRRLFKSSHSESMNRELIALLERLMDELPCIPCPREKNKEEVPASE